MAATTVATTLRDAVHIVQNEIVRFRIVPLQDTVRIGWRQVPYFSIPHIKVSRHAAK